MSVKSAKPTKSVKRSVRRSAASRPGKSGARSGRSVARSAKRSSTARAKGTRPSVKPADLLVEIGCEELPAAYLPAAGERLQELARQFWSDRRVPCVEEQVWLSPRRLTVMIRGLVPQQPDLEERAVGPSAKAAFDESGAPTQAAKGFAGRQGVSVSDLRVETTPKGEYVVAVKTIPGQPTVNLVQAFVEALYSGLSWPKAMRWDDTSLTFARPIRWLLVLYGDRVVRCRLGRVTSADWTLGRRQQGSPRIAVKRASAYESTLARHGIVADARQRGDMLQRELSAAAKRLKGAWSVSDDHTEELFNEVVHLTQSPQVITGDFHPEFAERLPQEVLLAAMAKGQRLFGVSNAAAGARAASASGASAARGRRELLPKFLAVLDGRYGDKHVKAIRRNIEHILAAKLSDALFFLEQDMKHGLELYRERLRHVVFLQGVGSVWEKTQRLEALTKHLASCLTTASLEQDACAQASRVCKADLASAMVKEFPSLQGIMGGWYAGHSGHSADVALAIREHYQPRFQGDALPSSPLGAVLAVADKLDSVVSCWWQGFAPTGNADAYGIRRAVQGIIAILHAHRIDVSFNQLLDQARKALHKFPPKQNVSDEVAYQIYGYFCDRLRSFFADQYPQELISAVMQARGVELSVVGVGSRLEQLSQIIERQEFAESVKVAERTWNIVKNVKNIGDTMVEPARLAHPSERQLWDVFAREESRIASLIQSRQYADAALRYGEVFAEPVHRFFDEVMVNVEDEEVRRNRLAMMRRIYLLLASDVGDFSTLAHLAGSAGKEKVAHGQTTA